MSRTTLQTDRESDVDVAVYVDDARAEAGPFGYQADLTAHLMAALGTNAVDVVVLNRGRRSCSITGVLRDGLGSRWKCSTSNAVP